MTRIIGHGGAGHWGPLNSRWALEHALAIGVDRIEVDLQRTADGILVLLHDHHLMSDSAKSPVSQLTFPQVAAVVPGIVRLDEAYEMTGRRIPLMLDVKFEGGEAEIAEAVRSLGAVDATCACATSPSVISRLRAEFPAMALGLSWGGVATHVPTARLRRAAGRSLGYASAWPLVQFARRCGASEANINHRIVTASLLERFHRAGLTVNAWTVDSAPEVERLLDLDVDGITSNRPDIVRDALVARGVDPLR